MSLREAVFQLGVVRWFVAVFFLGRAMLFLALGRRYRAISDFCWIVRVSGINALSRIAERFVFQAVGDARQGGTALVESYLADSRSGASAASFSLSGKGSRDIFRDLIVLKRATRDEKGVILLKYAKTFDAVVALFDLPRLMDRYTFVLEPCWAGLCDPAILMFIASGQPVIVQCFTEPDYEFISRLGAPLVPVRLGPADWVDADIFRPPQGGDKVYDLVMVANWAPHKRHSRLFQALEQIEGRRIRVLLIGFPWHGRTADDLRREAAALQNKNVQIDIIESLPPSEVAGHVGRCKALVFLSRKEGDNKALVEAMFANVPAIVYDQTVGGARSRINRETGILSSDSELPGKIVYMLDHHAEFSPRSWVLQHSGSLNASRILDAALRSSVIAAGGVYTQGIVEKTNSPNLAYKDQNCRARFRADYEFIGGCLRENGDSQLFARAAS